MKFSIFFFTLLFFISCSSSVKKCELHNSNFSNKLEQNATKEMEESYPGRIPKKVFKNTNN